MTQPTTLADFAKRLRINGAANQFSGLGASQIRIEVLSGLTVALALVPEAVAFAFVAGVDPLVGLYAAFMVGLITAVFGGRPGMISGATGALASLAARSLSLASCFISSRNSLTVQELLPALFSHFFC